MPFDELPDYFVKAVLATEDRRFFSHFGIDVVGTHPRADRQRQGGRRRPGRLVDHPATGQEPLPHQRALDRAQDQGSLSRAVARIPSDEEGDPQALSRPRLHGRRRLRRAGGRADLLRQIRARHQSRRGGDARRPVQGADEVLAARQSAGGAGARQRRLEQPGRRRIHDRGAGLRRPPQSRDPDRSRPRTTAPTGTSISPIPRSGRSPRRASSATSAT